jgi:hypothetical protein
VLRSETMSDKLDWEMHAGFLLLSVELQVGMMMVEVLKVVLTLCVWSSRFALPVACLATATRGLMLNAI